MHREFKERWIMPKLRRVTSNAPDGKPKGWMFWCPGCEEPHWFEDDKWKFNGDQDSPTFSPSLLIHAGSPNLRRCHLFIRDGQIQFLSDSEHKLSGQTVDMEVDW